jgi:hypothetical protein
MTRRLILLSLLTAGFAFGDLYDFSFSPTTGSVQAVSFELNLADPLADGLLSFTPFDVVENGNTELITQGSTGVIDYSGTDVRCFVFGTANATIGPGNCDVGVTGPPLSLFLGFNFVPIPASSMNSPGTYTTESDQFLIWGGTDPDFPNGVFGRGNMSLTISAVPEPSSRSLILAALGFAILAMAVRRLPDPNRL